MIELDRESLLVHARGTDRLVDLEAALAKDGLTLDLRDVPDVTLDIAAWLETGAEGARSAWLDPADHLVAGIATSHFTIRPAPRRAVGPDLLCLVLGAKKLRGGRFVQIESVWLRVHRKDVARPVAPFSESEEDDEKDDSRRMFDAIRTAFFR
jgi:alkyldihydroxyacetonephosphate synthase